MRTLAFLLFLTALSGLALSARAEAMPAPGLFPSFSDFASDFASSGSDAADDSAAAAAGAKDDLYRAAQRDLDAGRLDLAIDKFAQVARKRGSGADGALYWKAYAEKKAGKSQAALATVSQLSNAYPGSSWIDDAKALSVEIRGAGGALSTPSAPSGDSLSDDEELQLYALNGLLASRPERALPTLQKFLQGSHPLRLKEQALFVLSQSGSPEAHSMLLATARGASQPELQTKAIEFLGIAGGEENLKTLDEIFRTVRPEIQRSVLAAYMIAGQRQRIFRVAQEANDEGLKERAIGMLGALRAHDELRQLLRSGSPEVRKRALNGLAIAGDVDTLLEVARQDADPSLRREAIQGLGIGGGAKATEALRSLYSSSSDRSIRRAVINGLFIQQNAKVMIELFRGEKDREMRRQLVQQLSLMRSPEATEFLEKLYSN